MIKIKYYRTADGHVPVIEWMSDLDPVSGGRVEVHLDRMKLGNTGHSRSVGRGIMELKIDFGPGYRIYYLRDGNASIVLLCGGGKGSQQSDISKAQKFSEDYRRRK